MRLLNDLLIMYDGFSFDEWLNKCKKIMSDTFPREDPYSILVPPGFESFDIDKVITDTTDTVVRHYNYMVKVEYLNNQLING